MLLASDTEHTIKNNTGFDWSIDLGYFFLSNILHKIPWDSFDIKTTWIS